METVGQQLRQARESRGLSLEEVSRGTRIRLSYLQSLEDEEFDRLPAVVYARGFLRTYAMFLGLDPEPLLKQFEQAFHPILPSRPKPSSETPVRMWRGPSPRAILSSVVLVLVVAVIAFVFHQYSLFVAANAAAANQAAPVSTVRSFQSTMPAIPTVTPIPTLSPTRVSTSASVTTVATTTGAQTLTTSSSVASPEISPGPTATPSAPLNLSLHFLNTCWLRVTIDGKMVFEGTLQPGSTRTWTGQKFITIRLGNAGGVDVVFNGKDEGIAGASGQVVERTFRVG